MDITGKEERTENKSKSVMRHIVLLEGGNTSVHLVYHASDGVAEFFHHFLISR